MREMLSKYRAYYARRVLGINNASFSFSKHSILILLFEEISSSLLKIYLGDEKATRSE